MSNCPFKEPQESDIEIHLENFARMPDATIKLFSSEHLPPELQSTGGVIFNVQEQVASLSDNIPEGYKIYVMRHEVCCLSGHITKGHCRVATQYELSLVPKEIKQDYIKWRIPFLENLIHYMKNNPNDRNNHFAIEIQASVDYLKLELARISSADGTLLKA